MAESPRAYREKNPYTPPPAEYKPPSLLVQHWRLAAVFAILCIGFAVYCFKAPRVAPRAAPTPAAAPAPGATAAPGAAAAPRPSGASPVPAPQAQPTQPIYVEEVPEKDSH